MMPFAFEGLHFARPLWLLGLFALPLLAWAARARARRRSAWRSAVDPHLLPHLLEGGSARARWPWLALAVLALACMALAGPGWRRGEQPLWQARAPLVIALDLSTQTLAADLPPSRLLQARAKIDALLKARRGGQVALVAYADDAHTVSPLTDDVANVAVFLDALDPDVMPRDGQRPARAIAQAARLLRQSGFAQGDILLLTGATDAAARRAAARAAADGYRVSVLGLGTAAGSAYRGADGSIGHARLDAAALRALADAGGGGYAALQPGLGDLQALGVLDPARAGTRAARGQKGLSWLDQGYWLLPPLLLLGALAFRRGAVFAVLLLCVALPPLPGRAQAREQAPRAAEPSATPGTPWRRADQQAYRRMQQGEQAYRKGDFADAAQAYGAVDSADGAYNAGNALARQGRHEEAIAAYDRALRAVPGMPDAVANRKAVEAAMRRKPPQGANRNRPNPQSQQPGASQSRPGQQGKPADGDAARQQAQARRGDAGNDAQGRQRDARRDDRPPPDPDRQRAADAAQRQRMQRALQQQRQARDGQQVEGRPDRAEQAARRERIQANAAWLRRVPDDPGALLRAKFELEQERRRARGEE